MNVRINKILFLLSFIMIFQVMPIIQIENGNALPNRVQFNIYKVDWEHYSSSINFGFNFTIETLNSNSVSYTFSFDAQVHPYSVDIYYSGKYDVYQTGKGGAILCCLKGSVKPGINYVTDHEGIKVSNYSSSLLPDGIYIFSIEKIFGTNENALDYSNTTLIMDHGKDSIYYNTSVYSTGISFFIQQNLLLIAFLITLLLAIPISYFRFIKKAKIHSYHSSVRKKSSIIFNLVNGKLKKKCTKHNINEDTRFDHFFDDIENDLEN